MWGIGAVTMLLTSCSEGWGPSEGEGKGFISPFVEVDTKTVSSRSVETRTEIEGLKKEDLTLKLTKNDGTGSWTSKYSDFNIDRPFGVGGYTLEAYYGDPNEQGFEKPAVYGSTTLTVKDGETTDVKLTASLANSLVGLSYTQSFQEYMADWSASVNGISYAKDETRRVYVKPGDVTLKLFVTKPNGVKAEFTLDPVKAEAKHQYNVTIGLKEGAGSAVLTVTFDDDMFTEDIEIDLSDKILTAPVPVIDPDGFESGTPLKIISGLTKSGELSMSIIAQSGLHSVTMKTSSSSLQFQGWPAEIELMGADVASQSKLTGLGLAVLGLWKTPGEMAYIDFSAVSKNIAYLENSDNSTTITVVAKDILMRESEPVVLNIKVELLNLELSSAGEYFNPGNPLNVNLIEFNGTKDNIENGDISFQYYDSNGKWREIKVIAAKENTDGSYTVTLETPNVEYELKLKAVCGNVSSNILPVSTAPFDVEALDNNVFAKHAFIKVLGTEENADQNPTEGKFFIKKKNDSEYTEAQTSIEDGYVKIVGLDPDTDYLVKVQINDLSSKSTSLHTEAALPVPNGDFEDLQTFLEGYVINQGGYWSDLTHWNLTGPGEMNKETYNISEPLKWSTVNSKTCNLSSISLNTWFVVPSTYNTSDCQNGKNAMVIRNVGFNYNGTVPSRDSNRDIHPYNGKDPGRTSEHNAAGKLFLGNYKVNTEDLTEIYDEGYDFSSRPNKLIGYYKYITRSIDENDKGIIIVTIEFNDNIIVTNSVELDPVSDWTKFSVDLFENNKLYNYKSQKLKIMISSSNNCSYNYVEEDQNIKTQPITEYTQKYLGSELYIDNLQFEY